MIDTALCRRLTPEQFTRLVEACLSRRKEVIGSQEGQAWQMKRERYERIASGDHWYRLEAAGYGGRDRSGQNIATIFDKVNETLGIIQSVRRFLVARVCKDLFGSEPWFFVKPEGQADKDLSLKLQKHAGWKLNLADYKNKIKEAVGIALDLGECPIKTTWEKEIDISERLATLLTDKRTGQPVLTADGGHIEDDDETTGGDAATDAQGMPVTDESGQPVTNPISFAKAPEIELNADIHEWREHFVEEQTVLYQGLRIDPCHWKDVHWDINAPSIARSAFVSHTFDLRWSKLRERYAPDSFSGDAKEAAENPVDEEELEGMGADGVIPGIDSDAPSVGTADSSSSNPDDVMTILNSIKGESRGPKSYESQPRLGESEVLGGEIDDPIVKVCEVSYDFDCFEDGIPRRLWLVLLPDYDKCLHADFRANISPRAAKPIHLVTVNQVKHRAYGKGLHETYERMANLADELLCSILLRNKMISNPAKIWNPQRTIEGKADPTLKLGWGETLSIDGSQWGPKDILSYIEMPDADERTYKLMELFMQLIQVDSGVTNANQGDMTDLPSNTTATGVNSMLESSSVLHQYILEEIRDSLTPHLGYAIELIYKRQDANETFGYLEQSEEAPAVGPDGQPIPAPPDTAVKQVMELSDAKKLAGLAMQVQFLLTRAKRQEQREAALAGIPQAVAYGQMAAPERARLRPLFIQLFRALGFDDPDQFFPPITPQDMAYAPPPPKAEEVIKADDSVMTPSQQDAYCQRFGLPAAKPEELAAKQAAIAPPVVPGQPLVAPAPPKGPLPSNVIPDAPATPDDGTNDPAKVSSTQPFQEPGDSEGQAA